MKRLISTSLLVLAMLTSALFVAVQPPTSAVAEGSSAALSITPKKNYTIEPGKSVNDTLIIRNLDRERPLTLTLRVVDFTFNDETGAPKLMLAEDAPQTTWSLKPFLKLPKNVTVNPGETETIDMSVAIPANHGAGSYYSAIVYSSGDANSGNVGLSASGVTLVFTTIPGEVKEDLVLKKLGAYDSAKQKYSYFNSKEPQNLAFTIENKGNVTASPVGSITLKNIFGKEITIDTINPNGSLALIGQTRRFDLCIKQKKEEVNFNGSRTDANTCVSPGLWPGYYSVNMNAYYGQNGNNTRDLVGKGSFWYLPLWFVVVSIVVLAFVAYHVWRVVRFFRNRGSHKVSSKSLRK